MHIIWQKASFSIQILHCMLVFYASKSMYLKMLYNVKHVYIVCMYKSCTYHIYCVYFVHLHISAWLRAFRDLSYLGREKGFLFRNIILNCIPYKFDSYSKKRKTFWRVINAWLVQQSCNKKLTAPKDYKKQISTRHTFASPCGVAQSEPEWPLPYTPFVIRHIYHIYVNFYYIFIYTKCIFEEIIRTFPLAGSYCLETNAEIAKEIYNWKLIYFKGIYCTTNLKDVISLALRIYYYS